MPARSSRWSRLVRPHVAVITTVEPVHLEFFASVEAIADAKAEIFLGVEPGGVAVLNLDNPQFARLEAEGASRRIDRIVAVRRGRARRRRGCSICAASQLLGSRTPKILGDDIAYKLGMPGRHMAMNSLAVLAAAVLAGGDLAHSALALSQMQPPSGRGARVTLGFRTARHS